MEVPRMPEGRATYSKSRNSAFDSIPVSSIAAASVSTVPQRSPLRYPGGKTWLIPHVRHWLSGIGSTPNLLIEPFAEGGIVSLTAVMENLVKRCLMIELDHDVAAFWHSALRHGPELCRMIRDFRSTRNAVNELSRSRSIDLIEHGFRTLVMNRTRRGGILAPGASLSRVGENGKGVASRWYPETIIRCLDDIAEYSCQIGFCEGDGVMILDTILNASEKRPVVFIDPPYNAGDKRAGKRLYAHNEVDHSKLFAMLADNHASFLMTYDRTPEIEALIQTLMYRLRTPRPVHVTSGNAWSSHARQQGGIRQPTRSDSTLRSDISSGTRPCSGVASTPDQTLRSATSNAPQDAEKPGVGGFLSRCRRNSKNVTQQKHGFSAVQVMMKNIHHAGIPELVISPCPIFTK